MEQYSLNKITPVFRVASLINVAYYSFSENFSFEGEAHDFWELSYIERGQIVVQQEDKKYLLKSGEMIFCKPNVFHKCWVWQGENASVLTLAFDATGVDMGVFENNIIVLNSEERQCVAGIVREAKSTYKNFYAVPPAYVSMEKVNDSPFGSEQIICNRLEELMIFAFRGDRNILAESRIITAEQQLEGISTVYRIIAYMKEHLNEKITLKALANNNYISVSTLKRIFTQQMGCSVISYLTDLRIERAKQLIAEQKYTFSVIAEKTGFTSVHYFSSAFKKNTGVTPRKYLEQIKHF